MFKKRVKLIVGLGNPGDKYRYTRHNLGFIFLDKFREEEDFSDWKYESKFIADIAEGNYNWEKTIFVKPQTFMNLSGESLQKICNFYKLWAEDITVIYDDKDMDFGKVRFRETGSAGGHNGIKDIIKYFWGDWKRIKIWVGKTPPKYETTDWVLSKFSEEELIDLDNEVFEKITEQLTSSQPSPLEEKERVYIL